MSSTVSAINAVHDPTSWRELLRRQLELTGRRRWRELAMLGGLLATVQIAVTSLGPAPGTAAAEVFIEVVPQMIGSIGLVLVAVWPLSVWSDERPSRRAYHYSLPAERRMHDLARVMAGALWIAVTMVAAFLVGWTAYRVTTGQSPQFYSGFVGWVHYGGGSAILYLLVSAICLVVERPLWWLFGGWLALMVTMGLPGAGFLKALTFGPRGVMTAATGSVEGMSVRDAALPSAPILLWLSISMALLLVAATRHREATS